MQTLQTRTVLITGAAGGLGFSLAKAFAAAGARVAVTDVNVERLAAAADKLRAAGATVFATTLDVANLDNWHRAITETERVLGAINVLCNNAGIGLGAPLHLDDPARWRTVMEVNALGAFYGCHTIIPRMLAAGDEAHIVNIGSLSGLRSNAGSSSYNASKHAMVGMTDAMREELAGTCIGLSLIYPGVVRTQFVANSRSVLREQTGFDIDETLARQSEQIAEIQKLGMDPDKIGERVVRAVLAGEYHVFTHCDHKADLEAHYAERLAAFGDNADPSYYEDTAALQQAFETAKVR